MNAIQWDARIIGPHSLFENSAYRGGQFDHVKATDKAASGALGFNPGL